MSGVVAAEREKDRERERERITMLRSDVLRRHDDREEERAPGCVEEL